MYLVNNKGLMINGKIPVAKDPFLLEFEVQGTGFPHGYFRLVNDGYDHQKMLIDFQDGSEPFLMELSLGYTPSYFYQDLEDETKIGTNDPSYPQRRTIKIIPQRPLEIGGIAIQYLIMFGKLPSNIGNYTLWHSLILIYSGFTEFTSAFRGINSNQLNRLALLGAFKVNVSSLPEWIYNSRIKEIELGNEYYFNLPPEQSNLDKFVYNPILWSLSLLNCNNESLPANFSQIATLKILRLGGTFTKLPTNTGLITSLETLAIGWGLWFHTVTVTNWGEGIGSLVNLKELLYHGCDRITSDLPLGLQNCWKIRTIFAQRNFQNRNGQEQYHTDRHIDQYYNCINTYGDKVSTINDKFRDVLFEFGERPDKRPSGVYQQPDGFVLGTNNGNPISPMEKIWVLVKQYKWKIRIVNIENTNNELLT